MGLPSNLNIIHIILNSFLKMSKDPAILNPKLEVMNVKILDFLKPELFF